jgi:hypothetical protein
MAAGESGRPVSIAGWSKKIGFEDNEDNMGEGEIKEKIKKT